MEKAVCFFNICYLISLVLVFIVFGVEFNLVNGLIELALIIGMCLVTVSFGLEGSKIVRLISLINSPLWLIYNILHGSIGGTVCDSICIISIIIGYIRYEIKKGNNNV